MTEICVCFETSELHYSLLFGEAKFTQVLITHASNSGLPITKRNGPVKDSAFLHRTKDIGKTRYFVVCKCSCS